MAINENVNQYSHLQELGGSKFEVVNGEPNIKSWDVKDSSGRVVGDVDELLFDPETRKVHYLVVDLEHNALQLNTDRKVLVPIGIAELHGKDDEVLLPNVTVEQLNALPPYEKDRLTPQTESTIRHIFETGGAAGLAGTAAPAYEKDQFYSHEHFNEDKFFNSRGNNATTAAGSLPVIEENLEIGKKEVQTGGTRLTSRLVERPVQASITLTEEQVVVHHTPVNQPISAADASAFKEKEVEMTEYAEVPVVSKEARVVEEVSLNKQVEEREETIKDTVRSTEVEAEKIIPKKDLPR